MRGVSDCTALLPGSTRVGARACSLRFAILGVPSYRAFCKEWGGSEPLDDVGRDDDGSVLVHYRARKTENLSQNRPLCSGWMLGRWSLDSPAHNGPVRRVLSRASEERKDCIHYWRALDGRRIQSASLAGRMRRCAPKTECFVSSLCVFPVSKAISTRNAPREAD